MNTNRQQRFKAIDALRGIAALLVVWQHSAESFVNIAEIARNGSLLADIAKQFDPGRIGIICFFLISGFVIPASFQVTNKQALKHFAIRRIFRLYPAYWLSLITIGLYYHYIGFEIGIMTYLANSSMLQGLFSQPHLIGLYWTLQVELCFYLLCALLFQKGWLNNYKVVFIIIVVLISVFIAEQSLRALGYLQLNISKELQLLPYLLAIMLLGALFRRIFDTDFKQHSLNRYALLATLLCFGLPAVLLITSLLGYQTVEAAFRFGAAHVMALLLFIFGIKLLLKPPKFILWLGTISYSIYLFHPIVLQILMKIVKQADIPSIQGLHLIFYMTSTLFFSIILASIVYIIIEKPAVTYAKTLTK